MLQVYIGLRQEAFGTIKLNLFCESFINNVVFFNAEGL